MLCSCGKLKSIQRERMGKMGRKFSIEFKTEAVKRVVSGGEPGTKVARELGVNENSIRAWIKTYKENMGQPFVGSGNLRDIEEDNRQLRRQIRDLAEENEILKKAMAIFAREQKRSIGL